MSTPSSPSVFLYLYGNIVGTGHYFFKPGESSPATSIHGHPLNEFPCNGAYPVAVYHVTILRQYEHLPYPFRFKGTDGYPSRLGDLNENGLYYKAIVAWDRSMVQVRAGGSSSHVPPSNQDIQMRDADDASSDSDGADDDDNHTQTAADLENRVIGSRPGDEGLSNGGMDERMLDGSKTGKRKYTFRTRKRAKKPQLSARRQEWRALSRREDNPFLKKRSCCRKLKCFKFVNPIFAFAQYRRYMDMGRDQRKRELISMLDPDGKSFRFNGRTVCVRFLARAFKFSATIQSDLKGTPGARASASVRAAPRQVLKRTMRDYIVVYLRKLSESIGDNLPNKPCVNVPLLTKLEVYDEFCKEYVRMQPSTGGRVKVPCKSYFHTVWKRDCSNIKTYRHSGFTMCSKCEMIRAKIVQNLRDEVAQQTYRDEWKEHYDVIRNERRGYDFRAKLAIQQPSEFCSIIIDGADQKSYGLPHLRVSTKSDRGHKIKVKCIGALEHRSEKALTLYTMTEEYKTGANHVIEVAHRILEMRKARSGKLPKVLFIQVDNTSRENKNRYFLAYFEMLVALGVFLEVQVSCLPVGHTHADIDQAFSVVAGRLRHSDALTMEDLIQQLCACFGGGASAHRLDSVSNFSGLCEQSNCLSIVQNLTDYRFFKFTRNNERPTGMQYSTCCSVKKTERDTWSPLPVTSSRGTSRTPRGFLLSIPRLSNMPPTITRVPDNVLEVNKCLESMAERLRSEDKMQDLVELRNEVYTQRVDSCQWNMSETFEMNGDYRPNANNQNSANSRESEDDEAVGAQLDDLVYSPNDFLAIRPDPEEEDIFWIAQVIRVSRFDRDNKPYKIFVQWYTPSESSQDPFTASYIPATCRVKERDILFRGTVDVRTILVTFPSLSAQDKLTQNTRIALRSALSM